MGSLKVVGNKGGILSNVGSVKGVWEMSVSNMTCVRTLVIQTQVEVHHIDMCFRRASKCKCRLGDCPRTIEGICHGVSICWMILIWIVFFCKGDSKPQHG